MVLEEERGHVVEAVAAAKAAYHAPEIAAVTFSKSSCR
jgi:chorismate mutase